MSRKLSTRIVALLAIVLMASQMIFAGGAAESEDPSQYPSKEVTCIVIAAAGGGTDAIARAVTNPLEQIMGKPFVVINNGSAGGLIAMEDIYAATPDGYTIGCFSNTDVASFAYGDYDTEFTVDDFTYIAGINTTGDVLVLKKGSQFADLASFVDYAKANPGAITVGMPSPIQEMSLTLLSDALGVEVTGVTYDGGNKVLADLLGGHIEAGILSAKFIQQANENNLTVLGLLLEDRLDTFPEVPTFVEQGYDVSNPAVRMIVGPKGIDQAIVDKLVAAITEGFEGPIAEMVRAQAEVPSLRTGEELDAFLESDFAMREAYYAGV